MSHPASSLTYDPEVSLRVLLVYPNTWDVALANLGFQRVRHILNRIEGVECDLLALPEDWTPEVQKLSPTDMRSRFIGRQPREFDMIAFSISFEPDYLNVVTQLDYFGVPLERESRDNSHPLILAGGSAVFINPEPLADFVDVFFIGEAEGLAERFFRLFVALPRKAFRDQLEESTAIPGIYIPQFYHCRYEGKEQTGLESQNSAPARVMRYWVEDESQLITHSTLHNCNTAFKDMALLEATRGCIWACRFCTAGFIYRPPRLPDLEATYDSLSKRLKEDDQNNRVIGLVGPSVTDHPELLPLARRLVDEGKRLSFSSLRMETLNDELVDLMVRSGQKTVTVAVDAPSERMREVVNKVATDEFVLSKCRFLAEKGIQHIKIYSIIGLPGETEEDIDEFIELIRRVQKSYIEACRSRGSAGKITIGLSPLIPKPGTPFQWHPMERVDVLKKRFMRLRKVITRIPNVQPSFGSPNEAYLQTYLSRGDRRLSSFFKSYLENRGDVKRALRQTQPHPDKFVYRQYREKDFLPWDIVDHGYRNEFLWREYQRGLQELRTPVCDTATCKICGVC